MGSSSDPDWAKFPLTHNLLLLRGLFTSEWAVATYLDPKIERDRAIFVLGTGGRIIKNAWGAG